MIVGHLLTESKMAGHKENIMDNEIKEMLIEMQKDIKDIGLRLKNVENNQANVANAEHKNWHMLADKLGQYDLILHKIYGKKASDK
ncbi:hypothetical protein LL033_22505 [Clostridium estertheticum]|uniref:hypothetical protein n=2 Tax=Clostridium estertheticum TaxID=238834 RepID=UPI00227D4086|nr:hypothetical protein [Clostridium estertheticum]WAG55341.1 hypothetical protein LL033_22505 [Clostridium estertheticum]